MNEIVPLWSLIVIVIVCLPFFAYYLYHSLAGRKRDYEISFNEPIDGLQTISIFIENNKLESIYLHMEDGQINKIVQIGAEDGSSAKFS